jgi:hypothetical protein
MNFKALDIRARGRVWFIMKGFASSPRFHAALERSLDALCPPVVAPACARTFPIPQAPSHLESDRSRQAWTRFLICLYPLLL